MNTEETPSAGVAWLVLAAIVALLGLFVYVVARRGRRMREAWRRFAADHALRFQSSGASMSMEGTWRGVPLRFDIATRGTYRKQRRYTRAGASVEGFLPSGLGEDERAVRAFFEGGDAGEALRRLASGGWRPFVDGGWMGADAPGIVTDPRALGELADAVADAATSCKPPS